MKRERYSIIYSSKTGNTKKLAEAIYNTLPQNKCDYYGTVDKIDDVLSNVIYIGFWTEKGNADHLTIDFLNKLKNKKIKDYLFKIVKIHLRNHAYWLNCLIINLFHKHSTKYYRYYF